MYTTRDRLLDEGERLFAGGIHRVTTREIVDAAGQRNVSAVSYHFGSRDGLLREILARRGVSIDQQRGAMRAMCDLDPTPAELVECLVVPYVGLLDDPGGRAYLRIVAQLRGRFAAWRLESDGASTKSLVDILDELESTAGRTVGRESRIVGLIMLLTTMTADRAERIDQGVQLALDHSEFTRDLVAMCAAIVSS